MASNYQVFSEYNAYLRVTRHYLIRVSGNEEFLAELKSKLPEESGFELATQIAPSKAKTLVEVGNEISMDCEPLYVLVNKVPVQKLVELRFLKTASDLINFLTEGRFLQSRETNAIKRSQEANHRQDQKERRGNYQREQRRPV